MTHAVAIIPARGGSRRIPDKNIRAFAGKPIIAYSIEAAQRSELFDSIVVSTDSERIASVAREYGASVPFFRPASLADDFTPSSAVLAHALETLGIGAGFACYIYATAPFLTADDLRKGLDMITETGAATAFTVTDFSAPIFRALRVNDDGRLAMIWPEYRDTRSNDLPAALHDAGMCYWVDVRRFCARSQLYDDAAPIMIPRHRVHDIDTPEDWVRAELVFRALRENAGSDGGA
jgi:pseudaminic acid cytidylyltransferase